MTPSELDKFDLALRAQRSDTLADIREHLHASGDPGKMALLNHLEEVGDWVEADLLNDTDIALLGHELAKLREIDAALARIRGGGYGTCAECGEAIPAARLGAQPTAQCCVSCQEKLEKQHNTPHGASL